MLRGSIESRRGARKPGKLRGRSKARGMDAEEAAGVFRVLSVSTRIRILTLLTDGDDRSVGELSRKLGLGVATVSNQLRKMADLGIVGRTSRGNFAFYQVSDPRILELLRWAFPTRGRRDGRRRTSP